MATINNIAGCVLVTLMALSALTPIALIAMDYAFARKGGN